MKNILVFTKGCKLAAKRQPISRVSGKTNGLMKIALVFEGGFRRWPLQAMQEQGQAIALARLASRVETDP